MPESSEQWAKKALYDLETARAMFTSGRHLYVLFCCQQATEKMLKAIIAERTRTLPPRIHQLIRLTELAGLSPDDRQADFLRELSAYYIQSRYPEEIPQVGGEINETISREILQQTEELLTWLQSMR